MNDKYITPREFAKNVAKQTKRILNQEDTTVIKTPKDLLIYMELFKAFKVLENFEKRVLEIINNNSDPANWDQVHEIRTSEPAIGEWAGNED